MRARSVYIIFVLLTILTACSRPGKQVKFIITASPGDSVKAIPGAEHVTHIETGTTTPLQLVNYANTLRGVPYKYASINPSVGFDCSGYITYVFNHFGIAVPRASVDFTPVNHPVELKDAKPGDLILFTGTDTTVRVVGHMGIISSPPGMPVTFLHSTSGKAKGVVETPLEAYYMSRFIKIIRVFPQNDL